MDGSDKSLDPTGLCLQSNWDVAGGNDLQKAFTFSSEEILEAELDDILSLESCICLVPLSGSTSAIQPQLEIKVNQIMTQLDIICEAQIIELFGTSEEYLQTCHTEFVDEWEGMAAYHVKISLPNLSTCLLKFTRLKKENRLWIYGIRVTVHESSEPTKSARFNFDHVNKLIENSSYQISEKAEKFKNFFQSYSANSAKNVTVPPHLIFSALEGTYGSQLKDCKRSFSQYLNRFEIKSNGTNSGSYEGDSIKTYIELKLKETEENILREVERRLDQQNAKLDAILAVLNFKCQKCVGSSS